MFFFIGGVQPKTVDVDNQPMLCPSCGLLRARHKRVDHYLSLFFIPILPVKRGEPFLFCDRCGVQSREQFHKDYSNNGSRACKNCGRRLESDFSYCPFCGKSL
jgi:hypothetical protein